LMAMLRRPSMARLVVIVLDAVTACVEAVEEVVVVAAKDDNIC